jgi:hypothetical protein
MQRAQGPSGPPPEAARAGSMASKPERPAAGGGKSGKHGVEARAARREAAGAGNNERAPVSDSTATGLPVAASPARRLPSPFAALIGYTLRACLPVRRWLGVLLPCAGALLFGWLSAVDSRTAEAAFGDVAEIGLFGLVLPLTCLVIGDAVLGADIRAGTFPLTWLSPVGFGTIVAARWLGGWIVALVSLVPALVLATVVAGVPEGAAAMAIAGAAGSAAYIGLFVMIGAAVRRAAVWALAVVFLGERLLGGVLSGIAQVSPMWESQQVYAGLADDHGGWRLLRDGTPNGWSAVVRLAVLTIVTLAVASWRLRHLKPRGGDE